MIAGAWEPFSRRRRTNFSLCNLGDAWFQWLINDGGLCSLLDDSICYWLLPQEGDLWEWLLQRFSGGKRQTLEPNNLHGELH
jgi:hypothetical protein